MIILVEHGIAYNVTAEEFAVFVADRSEGVFNPLGAYGFEAGGCLGDVSDFGQSQARVLRAAMETGVAGGSPALKVKVAEVEALIDEATMYFVSEDTVAA